MSYNIPRWTISYFGGWEEQYDAHYIWDETKQELEEIHNYMFDAIILSRRYGFAYLKCTNSALFIRNSWLYEYNLLHKTFATLQLSDDLVEPRVVTTLNEEYIICLSDLWEAERYYKGQEIYLIDARTRELTGNYIEQHVGMNPVTCLVMFNDYEKTEYLSHGFVHEYSQDFPMDITRIISKFITMEIVYVFSSSNGGLYKIKVDAIIEKCVTAK